MAQQSSSAHHPLRLFLDSADAEAWREFLPTGVFYGVTTNPLLLQRAHLPCTLSQLTELRDRAADFRVKEIHLQTWGEDFTEMTDRGLQIQDLDSPELRVAVKVPATGTGFRVASKLKDNGCRLTMTAIYEPGQVLLAAGLGASYAAPYLGRMDDMGLNGRQVITAMNDILDKGQDRCRLLVASLRSGHTVCDLAARGFNTFTFGSSVAEELIASEATARAVREFQSAATGNDSGN